MIVSIMQPYFLPYLGYFQLINKSDLFVIYDDVNYIKGGWINRNQYLDTNGEVRYFTLPISGGSSNAMINKVALRPSVKKLEKTLTQNYAKAPNFKEVSSLISNIFAFETDNLSKFVTHSIKQVTQYMNIATPIICSSELNYNREAKGQERVIEICNKLNATHYINNISGAHLYDEKVFASSDLILSFHRAELCNLNTSTKYLSILHQLMWYEASKFNL